MLGFHRAVTCPLFCMYYAFIPAQDHARHSLLLVLYAPRERLSSTLGPRAATGMRDAGYELPRIPVLRLYEKSSEADQPPQHEATHGSIYERLAART